MAGFFGTGSALSRNVPAKAILIIFKEFPKKEKPVESDSTGLIIP
jgi:hypothetical protein